MTPVIDLTGRVFGKLTIIARADTPPGKKGLHWLCACACGITEVVSVLKLRKGKKSCGCLASPKIDLIGQTTATTSLGTFGGRPPSSKQTTGVRDITPLGGQFELIVLRGTLSRQTMCI